MGVRVVEWAAVFSGDGVVAVPALGADSIGGEGVRMMVLWCLSDSVLIMEDVVGVESAAVVTPAWLPGMFVPGTIVSKVVTGKDSISSVVFSNVTRDLVADISETVVVMDPNDVTSMPDVFKAIGVVIMANFEESVATDDSSPLAAELDVNEPAAGALWFCFEGFAVVALLDEAVLLDVPPRAFSVKVIMEFGSVVP